MPCGVLLYSLIDVFTNKILVTENYWSKRHKTAQNWNANKSKLGFKKFILKPKHLIPIFSS